MNPLAPIVVQTIWPCYAPVMAEGAGEGVPAEMPAIIRPICSIEAPAGLTIPMMQPSNITAILSDRFKSSSNSAEISRIALPSCRARSSSRPY